MALVKLMIIPIFNGKHAYIWSHCRPLLHRSCDIDYLVVPLTSIFSHVGLNILCSSKGLKCFAHCMRSLKTFNKHFPLALLRGYEIVS